MYNICFSPLRSALSTRHVKHVLFFGTAAIYFVLPTHPQHLVCHLMYYVIFVVTTHTGFEEPWLQHVKRLHLGTFHHKIHHRHFEMNCGGMGIP